MSSPEFILGDPDEHIDACAQDVYGIGLLLLMLSTGYKPADRSLHKLRQSHREWVSSLLGAVLTIMQSLSAVL